MRHEKKAFLDPKNPTHRQYEALRAFFVDEIPQAEAAKNFGYTLGSFRVMCSNFRKNLDRQFFAEPRRGPQRQEKGDALHERIIALRKRNLSIYEIAQHLQADGRSLTPAAVSKILKKEGFARLPRRRDEDIAFKQNRDGVDKAPVADVNNLDLNERTIHTKFGGLFLFLPMLAEIPFDQMVEQAQFPGSKMIPAPHALRALMALKLFGNARHTHVMSDVFDQGLGLFAGLNIIPKASFLSQYSCRIDPDSHPHLLRSWFDAIKQLDYQHGESFDLDFHTIPSHGEDPMLQKHYTSKRSRRQKGILAFVANDTENRAFCYVNADLRKETQDDEILQFIEFWKQKSGAYPKELVFDSTFATYSKLHILNRKHIKFITLRRRTSKVLDAMSMGTSY